MVISAEVKPGLGIFVQFSFAFVTMEERSLAVDLENNVKDGVTRVQH